MGFWRGIVAGGLLGALLGMLLTPQKQQRQRRFWEIHDSGRPDSRTRRIIKGVTKSVGDMIGNR
ncbi:hypothetical protein A6M21_11330 [Desulfotomaculum copahuensis]|uniref:YtxH domain-containing protein n=1 Tax=Desulfotomaculum copahuensis TaxID=1838280 RepID=A0A1B7LED6_9FIRM|nr:hypothetical protein A6M21_11330 [Desulfotomaculum copahuensis]